VHRHPQNRRSEFFDVVQVWDISKFGASMKFHITIPLTPEFDTAEKIRAEYERQLAIIKANVKARGRLNARTKKRTLNPRRDILDLATLEFIEPQERWSGTRGLSRTRH
jgi:hypothetical protein